MLRHALARAKRVALRLLLAAAVLTLAASVACGGKATPAPSETRPPTVQPTPAPPTSAPAPTFTPVPVELPITRVSRGDLGGGSPDAFAEIFREAASASRHRPAIEFAAAARPRPAGEKLKVGFIFDGPTQDLGRNQAAYEGSLWVERATPGIEALRAEKVFEPAEAQRVAVGMIEQGAKIIFAAGEGYGDAIEQLAPRHPGVVFLHHGGSETLENYGVYSGDIWQLQYAAGQAAGRMTKSDTLGFIAALPTSQALLGVNAYHLGARSVNPAVETAFVSIGAWCDAAKERSALQRLVDRGVDTIAAPNTCARSVVEAASAAGVQLTGHHQDGRAIAPDAWIVGAAWNWGPVYTELVAEIMNGSYRASPMSGGLEAGWVRLTPFGAGVPEDVKTATLATVESVRNGAINPFTGPIKDQSGAVKIPEGAALSGHSLRTIDWLAEGITSEP